MSSLALLGTASMSPADLVAGVGKSAASTSTGVASTAFSGVLQQVAATSTRQNESLGDGEPSTRFLGSRPQRHTTESLKSLASPDQTSEADTDQSGVTSAEDPSADTDAAPLASSAIDLAAWAQASFAPAPADRGGETAARVSAEPRDLPTTGITSTEAPQLVGAGIGSGRDQTGLSVAAVPTNQSVPAANEQTPVQQMIAVLRAAAQSPGRQTASQPIATPIDAPASPATTVGLVPGPVPKATSTDQLDAAEPDGDRDSSLSTPQPAQPLQPTADLTTLAMAVQPSAPPQGSAVLSSVSSAVPSSVGSTMPRIQRTVTPNNPAVAAQPSSEPDVTASASATQPVSTALPADGTEPVADHKGSQPGPTVSGPNPNPTQNSSTATPQAGAAQPGSKSSAAPASLPAGSDPAEPVIPARASSDGAAVQASVAPKQNAPATQAPRPATAVAGAPQPGVTSGGAVSATAQAEAGASTDHTGSDAGGQEAEDGSAETARSVATAPTVSPDASQAPAQTAAGQVVAAIQGLVTPNVVAQAAKLEPAAAPGATPTPDGTDKTAASGQKSLLGKKITIQLNPDNLGSVSITMRMRAQSVDIQIEVANQQTLHLLEKDRHLLSAAVASQGGSPGSLILGGSAEPESGAVAHSPQQQNAFSSAASSGGNSQGGEGRSGGSGFNKSQQEDDNAATPKVRTDRLDNSLYL